ncbi:uncharacterized protein LOC111121301 isoform X2 [Crassostrea virginica]
MTLYRCRKCRNVLFSDDCVISDHGQKDDICSTSSNTTVWFLSSDSEKTPEWIYQALDRGSWSKGKLYCPKCNGRIGSFDFISGNKCLCGQFTLPPLHILSCRVDKMSTTIQQKGIVNQYQRRPIEQATHTQTQDLLSLGHRGDVPSFGLTIIETEVPVSTTDDKTCQSSANAAEHLKGSEHKKKRARKRRMLIGEVPAYEEQNVTYGNQYEILQQERDGDSCSGHELPTVTTVSEEYCCSVCLDIYCYPTKCDPCCHTFCDPCLRRLARTKPRLTPCPLCRVTITSCTLDTELGERLTNAYPQEYKERIQKERKVCSDRFYPLPKCTYPSLHRGRLTDISGVTRGQVILMAILFTACVCISPLKSLAHSLFNVLLYCLDMLINFFDSAATVMAVHDILQLF